MTMLSQTALHCCRASDSSNELTPEEGGEVAEPKDTKDDRKPTLFLHNCRIMQRFSTLNPKYHLGPNATSLGVYFATLRQSC